jgi:hypothetical protein
MNLGWALNRLSVMSGREIGYRVKQQLRAGLEKLVPREPRLPRLQAQRSGEPWVSPLPRAFDVAKYRYAADRILAGEFDVFALSPARLGFPPEWNRDPKTGRTAPLAFGKTLNYRDERLVGDIKYLWDPSRHAELVTLAQAWHLTGDAKYALGCRTLLDSWFEQCPYRQGVHWTSSLELAIRLINWSFTWYLLGGKNSVLFESEDGKAFRDRWLTSVYRHCDFIRGHLSRYSSANNHLLGELTGLFVAAWTWPFWKESERWLALSRRELEREALTQNASDGVNKEQAIWYHHEVADMMIVAGLVARANHSDFGPPYWHRLRAMLDFIASVMDAGGNVPAFGDADDAIIARLDPDEDRHVYRSLLTTGAVLFRSGQLKFKSGGFDDKSRWLLGDAAAEQFDRIDCSGVSLPVRRDFPEGGYCVLGDAFESDEEIRIVADSGPLGYLSIAAHGHADALSFTLSARGYELLIDPGTFAYHTQKRWRDYFRGTSAHNTIRVDRVDQSVSGGNFLWTRHARARLLAVEHSAQFERWVAEHDGYARLDDPVLHRRELRLDKAARQLTVIDDLQCRGGHLIEIFWHFAEECSVTQEGSVAHVSREGVRLSILLPQGLSYRLSHGVEAPAPEGWLSRSFDRRVPCPTLVASGSIVGATRFETQMHIEFTAREMN